ncbi:ribosome biogenesis factor YjgA [Novosphingobium sp.]|uniref:ribosome biogenesis factor YjgA n=1 Tax=Novosphingobium sp. TaxID=1874826 RepID=UPI003D12415E
MKKPFAPDTPYDNHDDLQTLSEMKEGAESVQELGAQIVALSARQLQKIPLEGALQDAIMEARRLTGGEAKRRQIQFIGRLMRSIDAEPLRLAVAALRFPDPQVAAQQRQVQQWVERFLNEGAAAIDGFLQVANVADRTQLSQVVRQARKDHATQKAARAQLQLSKYIDAQLNSGA